MTSTDPDYRDKLAHVHDVLADLAQDEHFFSVDEFVPFAIKTKPGRRLVAPDEHPSVPQWQKSKGWLIATAALEISHNQVTHFYSRAKNTAEMIRMVETLIAQYRESRTLYISWDAASWHVSKELRSFIDRNNQQCKDSTPKVKLVPLPASAQFLNVIEAVFSGMARAIIHNSDYATVQDAREAIDRYFQERNHYFAEYPKRSGHSIWGKERSSSAFDNRNNARAARSVCATAPASTSGYVAPGQFRAVPRIGFIVPLSVLPPHWSDCCPSVSANRPKRWGRPVMAAADWRTTFECNSDACH